MNDPFAGWAEGPANPSLPADEVHVRGWDLRGRREELAGLEATLSEDELARMRAFHFDMDAERFVWARGGLRKILGAYLSLSPAGIRFTFGKYGKPYLAEGQRGIHFNLSHTKTMAVAAFGAAGPVGIDVEQRHPVSRTLGDPVFSEREQQTLKSVSNERYTEAFFNGWTRKEAICKAEGLGFHLATQGFSVSLVPGQPARIDDAGGVLSRDWSLIELPMGGAVTGCVAVAAPSTLRLYRTESIGASLEGGSRSVMG